jgi:hypothetical protein
MSFQNKIRGNTDLDWRCHHHIFPAEQKQKELCYMMLKRIRKPCSIYAKIWNIQTVRQKVDTGA